MRRSTARGALELGALGVVFGDIGTSPLYTVQTVFSPSDPHPVRVSPGNVFGVVSLIFWAVTIVVTVTYVLLVMRADNDGEGGIMALISLIRRRSVPSGRRAATALALLGVFGASLFFGDSMITPAISVLSAIEGVKVAAPSVGEVVVPITAAVLVGLFVLQRLGTGAVVADADRLEIDDLGYKDDRIYHVTARFGYMDAPVVPSLLPLIDEAGLEGPLDDGKVSYFLSTIEVHRGNAPGMSRWRKRLFIATARLTTDAAEYFRLPRERTVIMGSRIEL
jgi:K+ transporter